MEWFLGLVKRIFGEPLAIAIGVFVFACLFVWQVPKWVVTMDTFAGEKQCIYQTIQKGDYWHRLALLEMELRSLTRQKWTLEDRIDKNVATPRDLRRLQEVNTQINNLQIEMNNLRKYLRGINGNNKNYI